MSIEVGPRKLSFGPSKAVIKVVLLLGEQDSKDKSQLTNLLFKQP